MKDAVSSFLSDKEQQSLSPNWHQKLKREMNTLASWCDSKVMLRLSDITLHALEKYRATWTGAPITRRKRQERLRSFWIYCIRHKWTSDNLAALLSPIRVQQSPTLPLSRDQFSAVLKAAELYNRKSPDAEWRRQRAIAMLLLLRWSGLRLGDAARLERSALSAEGSLRLYMQKTGEAVFVPLPPDVVKVLRELKNTDERYFFWHGGNPESAVKRWWTTLKAIFRAAGVPDAHPHQLRDTFAVECLLAGVPLDQVSILLGHSSTKITERHYSPWIRARQEQLEASVRKAWNTK